MATRKRKPPITGRYVVSATQTRSGRAAEKSRCRRLGAMGLVVTRVRCRPPAPLRTGNQPLPDQRGRYPLPAGPVTGPLIIDVVAAVKEALRDATIRDQIRAIVVECAPSPANDIEDLLDARGAATFLGLTPAALRMAVYRGTIRCVRIGRRLRFRRSDLLER